MRNHERTSIKWVVQWALTPGDANPSDTSAHACIVTNSTWSNPTPHEWIIQTCVRGYVDLSSGMIMLSRGKVCVSSIAKTQQIAGPTHMVPISMHLCSMLKHHRNTHQFTPLNIQPKQTGKSTQMGDTEKQLPYQFSSYIQAFLLPEQTFLIKMSRTKCHLFTTLPVLITADNSTERTFRYKVCSCNNSSLSSNRKWQIPHDTLCASDPIGVGSSDKIWISSRHLGMLALYQWFQNETSQGLSIRKKQVNK